MKSCKDNSCTVETFITTVLVLVFQKYWGKVTVQKCKSSTLKG